ncbi:MAG: hypothetical protein ACQEUZ_07795 [Pseudomonadota bacterium]
MLARLVRVALLALLAALPVSAQEGAPGREELTEQGEDIPLGEWRAMTAGRTVWYRIGEDLWGRERYHAGTDRVTFQFPDGECLEAVWFHDPPWYCFDFGGALGGGPPHCFRHLRHEGELWALGLSGGAPQRIIRIDDLPLSCGPSPSV